MTDVKRYDAESGNEHGAGIYCDGDGDYVKFTDYQALQAENERLTQKTLDQFVEIQDLRRVANDLKGESEKLKLQKTEIMKGVSEFQQMEVVAENKLKADAVREFVHSVVVSGRVMEEATIYASKLEAGE